MGGLVNYFATTQSYFPEKDLGTIFTLNSPLNPSPQYFNNELQFIPKISKSLTENILHINLHSGPRDHLVKNDVIQTFPDVKWAINLSTQRMKNVHQSLDHNAVYYYKHFLDAFVPSALSLMTSELPIDSKHKFAK